MKFKTGNEISVNRPDVNSVADFFDENSKSEIDDNTSIAEDKAESNEHSPTSLRRSKRVSALKAQKKIKNEDDQNEVIEEDSTEDMVSCIFLCVF